ncbi:MAG TPA: hypothetical protein DCR43_02325 [Bacteroidales bacterium]|nr:MAG: hypothetical protein A2X11_07565 [Bacteroidetes bacterium GWE2_42_24]OFY29485.1 MAG: hypothetical protein A2X09_04035 [Bacteroidetes bacterium GWF2_43_11]HAQ64685.1 hypothetical protein [Bacteroidales bacterium]HBZ67280.1 hypothetical protein [Bacteroidales bacterium]
MTHVIKANHRGSIIGLFISLILLIGCQQHPINQALVQQNFHQFAFGLPAEQHLAKLPGIGHSVKKIGCYAEYTTWVFTRNSGIRTGSDFTILSSQAVRVIRTPESVIGTATILSYSTNKVLAVTCAHVVDFPDTVYTYHEADITGEPLIYTASIKKSQINYVKEVPVAGGLKILAIDKQADLVLLGGTLSQGLVKPPALPIRIGDSREITEGNRAWVFGFPIGYMMMTEALVNGLNVDRRGSFMLDAVFNPGFSGGLTLTFNVSRQQFEVSGFGRSAPSSTQLILTPAGIPGIDKYAPMEPYTDKVFVQQRSELAYGLTFVTPSEALLKLINENKDKLINEGYDLNFLE